MSQSTTGVPAPLRVTAYVTMVQALAALVMGVLEVVSFSGERAVMGITTAIFFVVYGGFLLVAARQLLRPAPWARGPILLAQLIWLGVAWSFKGGSTTWLAVLLAVSALVALGGLLHPKSREALEY